MKPARVALLVLCAVLAAQQPSVRSEPFATAFTFQAQLDQGGSPLNGTADLRFELFGVEKGGTPVGTTATENDLSVTGGLVNVRLDFGVDVFDGDDRWLEVSIRSPHDPSDTMPFTTLSPRQPVSPIPYALQTRGLFVNEDGQVAIGPAPELSFAGGGPPNPTARLHVRGTPAESIGVLAEVTAMTGDATGVKGLTEDPGGRGIEGIGPSQGVRGESTATSGTTHGVAGINCSDVGAGVMGHALDASGSADGVHGKTESSNGRGVFGEGKSEGVRGETLGNELVSRGVCGVSASETGEGVVGHTSSGIGPTTGVRGMSDSVDGTGVVGQGGANGAGVVGQAAMEGVRGEATADGGRGVCGINSATAGDGVFGHASAGSGPTTGVRGMSDSPDGAGVVGQAVMEGVRGEATGVGGRGVCGINTSSSGGGVFGHTTAVSGNTVGVHGMSDSVDGGAGMVGQAVGNGTGVVGNAPMEGVRGLADAGTGPARGVCGISSSINGEGVFGEATATNGVVHGVHGKTVSGSGRAVFGEATATTGQTYGVYGFSASSAGYGVYGEVTAPGSGAIGVYGYSPGNNGVKGRSDSGKGVIGEGGFVGVEAIGLAGPNESFGVLGWSQSESDRGAAVFARGNGTSPGGPRAAALRIEDGAITVFGPSQTVPAGRVQFSGPWSQTIDDCSGAVLGWTQDVTILNDLIVQDSIIWATVEQDAAPDAGRAFSVVIFDKLPGTMKVRVSAVGVSGPCTPPILMNRYVSYLIINPLP